MPLKLIAPRAGKSPYYAVRGTYLGVYVDRSTKARKRAVAAKVLKKWEDEIERGAFSGRPLKTFADAAVAYMKAGGERRFVTKLLQHFGERPLMEIGQEEVDAAAVALYPTAAPSTRNRQVYSPVSAILKRAGFKDPIDRPIGSAGNKTTGWLWPEQANALFEEAGKLNPEFRLLCVTLLYAGGLRLSEGLDLMTDDCRLSENFAYLADSKTGEPRPLFLPPFLVVELANHPRGMDRPGQKVFHFTKGGHIYSVLKTAAFKAGVDLPPRQAFHIFCHTYGTWMRRYAGLDELGLLKLGRWEDRKSVERYTHVVVSEEAKRAELLPAPKSVRA
jgi:integrase